MCGILGGVDYQTNDEVIRWMKSSLPLMADRDQTLLVIKYLIILY